MNTPIIITNLRDLDELVATRVLLLKVEECKQSSSLYIVEQGFIPQDLPRYSMNIAAAWSVVELLEKQNYQVTISFNPAFKCWWCLITKSPIRGSSECDSMAATAICLAALDILGIDVELNLQDTIYI